MKSKPASSILSDGNGKIRKRRYSIALAPEVEEILNDLDRLPCGPADMVGNRARWLGFVLDEAILSIAALGEKKGHLYWPMRLDVTGVGKTHWSEHMHSDLAIEKELAQAAKLADKLDS